MIDFLYYHGSSLGANIRAPETSFFLSDITSIKEVQGLVVNTPAKKRKRNLKL